MIPAQKAPAAAGPHAPPLDRGQRRGAARGRIVAAALAAFVLLGTLALVSARHAGRRLRESEAELERADRRLDDAIASGARLVPALAAAGGRQDPRPLLEQAREALQARGSTGRAGGAGRDGSAARFGSALGAAAAAIDGRGETGRAERAALRQAVDGALAALAAARAARAQAARAVSDVRAAPLARVADLFAIVPAAAP